MRLTIANTTANVMSPLSPISLTRACEKRDIRNRLTLTMIKANPTTHSVIWVGSDLRILEMSRNISFYFTSLTIFFSDEPKMIYCVLPAMVPSFCPHRKGQSS